MRILLAGSSIVALLACAPAFAQTGAPTTPTDPQQASSADQAPPAAPAPSAPPIVQRGSVSTSAGGDIVVTAARYGEENPSVVSRVSRDSVIQSGGASIGDSLASVPGVATSGFAPGASRPIIRGQDATRVRILEDGSSSSDVSDIGPDHGVPIDPLSARSIDVIRGAATLRYGSQAIGGVVNITNNRVPTSLSTKPLTGEVTGAFDSVSSTGEGTALMDGTAGQIAAHADGFYRNAGDYDTPLGRQANSFFRGYGLSAGASYFSGADSHIGGAVERYTAQYGIPSDTTHIDLRQTKYLLRSSFGLGSGTFRSLSIDGSYADYAHDEDDPDGTILTTFRNKEADGHAELTFNNLGPLRNSAIGGEIRHRDFSAVGADSSYLFPTVTDTQAAYLFTEALIGTRFHLQASGRVEHTRETGTPPSNIPTAREFTPLSAAVGALLDIGSTVHLGVTASTTGRAPAITELFARGGHDGPNTFETGDPNLKIERARSIEATLRIDSGRFGFEGSLYSAWFRNYIYGNLTGRSCDDQGDCVDGDARDLTELNYAQRGAWFRGAEAQGHFDVIHAADHTLQVRALADYTRATLEKDGNVPRIPPYRVGGGINWASTKFDAGALFVRVGRQDEFGAFDTPTPGYNQLTAQFALRPFASKPGVELAVIGQNLTDDVQRNAASFNRDEIVAPGRNIRVVLRVATF